MESKIKIKEQKHLDLVLKKLKDANKILSKSIDALGKGTLERLRELREGGKTDDFYVFFEQLHEKHEAFNIKDKYKRIEELSYLRKEPYFSRIDLHDKNTAITKRIYIGKFGYSEKNPVVTDWRTKVASVYYRYRYPQQNVEYETPEGKVTSDLKLKRTYEIDSGELLKYYNNDLQLDENEIILEKIEERTGGVLEDIVETIQESQLDIIEADPRQVLIVQGCVGSGKSTVAIHKLAHIFFNYPKIIKPERSILIAKNQILVSYLSTLFPKLGIFDLNYKTLSDLIINLVFREEIKITTDFTLENKTSKFDTKKQSRLRKKIAFIHKTYETKIENIFKPEGFESFGGFKYTSKQTPFENVSEALKDMEEELSFQKQELKGNPKSPRTWFYKENISSLRRIIRKLLSLRNELKRKVVPRLVKEFGLDLKSKLNYQKTLIYIYVYASVIGFSKVIKYEYCVVDEGQDFSLLEYLVLNKFVIRGRLSIFGDLNQSMGDDGIANWEDIKKAVPEAAKASVFKLDTNYRSTKQIIDLANKVIGKYTTHFLPKSINRMGKEPIIELYKNEDEMLNDLQYQLSKDKAELDKSIGVIAFGDNLYNQCKQVIKKVGINKNKVIYLEDSNQIIYIPKGVYASEFKNCKGLEFAKVYVVGLNLKKVENFSKAREAFIAITRAMNELIVYGIS